VLREVLPCFVAVTKVSYIHTPMMVGALKPRGLPAFKWITTVSDNLKAELPGAFKGLKFRKYT
jgi:hypothetical protein